MTPAQQSKHRTNVVRHAPGAEESASSAASRVLAVRHTASKAGLRGTPQRLTCRTPRIRNKLLALASLLPLAAFAHPGGDGGIHQGLVPGLAHPFLGLDHLAAMLAVGFWSALCLRHALWAPAAFAACLLLGALVGLSSWTLAGAEPMVAASLLAVGLLVAVRARWHAGAAAALVGGFAVFHGLAHGMGLAGESAVATLAGMMLGTVILHVVGLVLGYAVRHRSAWWPRVAGAAVAATGLVLLPAALLS